MRFNELVNNNRERAHEQEMRRSLVRGIVVSIALVLAALVGFRKTTTIELHDHYRD